MLEWLVSLLPVPCVHGALNELSGIAKSMHIPSVRVQSLQDCLLQPAGRECEEGALAKSVV